MEQEQQEQQEQQLQRLDSEIRKSVAAEKFFETATGKLFVELAEKEINNAITDILSSRFEKDHSGYLARKADLNAYKKMLNMMSRAGSPEVRNKLLEKREELESGE